MSLAKCRAFSAKADSALSNTFGSIANVVSRWPAVTLIATTLLAFVLAPGMVIGGSEQNGENLWTPQDTLSKDQQVWVDGTFGKGDRRVQAYSTNGGNLLTQASLEALEKLHTDIEAITAKCELGSCDGKTITYPLVKTKAHSSVLSLFGDKAPVPGTDIIAAVNDQSKWFSSAGEKLRLSDMLGGVQYDSNGKISGAEAFLTTYWLREITEDVENDDKDPWSESWELEFDDLVKDYSVAGLSKSYPWTRKGQEQAGGNAIRKDVSMLSIGYMLLIIYSIVVLSHHKRVQSNGVMALASVFSVVLSIMSAFGLGGYLGVKQNPVTTTLFLVLLGIGVDDSYVIMGDYRLAQGSPLDRVVKGVTKAGTSIAVTSMTDTVAFAAGASSSLPALRDFCIFAAIGIFFDFFFQITWFVAVLTFRSRCTEANRPDWACCFTVDPESTGCCNCSLPVCSRGGKCVCCPCTKDGPDGETEGFARTTLKKITNVTLTPIGSAVVILIAAALVGSAASGLPQLKTNFDIKWFVPDDNSYKDTFDIQGKYFPTTGQGFPVDIFTKAGNYYAAHADGSLAALYARVEAEPWIDRSVSNWYTDFVKQGPTANNEVAFAAAVKAFVSSPAGARFAKDLVFSVDGSGSVTGIQASKSMFLAKETKDGTDDIECMNAARKTTEGAPFDAFAFAFPFLYFDGLAVVDEETIHNVVIACVCVFVVNLVMLADVLAATLVLTMIALIDVCILGFMPYLDLDFNSVTAINLVLAVGLAVDYSAHIAHSFLVIQGPGRERAKQAVEHIGMSVLHGAFSTFLAVFPLALSKSYVFRVFFKMWFMIIIFGVYFGVFVLPVVLSICSPLLGAPVTEASADVNQGETIEVKPEGIKNSPDVKAEGTNVSPDVITIGQKSKDEQYVKGMN